MISEYITTFARILLGLLFAYSFAKKIIDVPSFVESITDFGLLPKKLSLPLAIVVLLVELALTISFIMGNSVLSLAFLLATVLLAVFSFALFIVLQKKKKVTCNCFGSNEKVVTNFDLVRNIGFILSALIGLFTTLFTDTTVNLSVLDWGVIGLVASFFLIICLNLGDIGQLLFQN